jgi:tetratricopeptide (TPR) repeat protein
MEFKLETLIREKKNPFVLDDSDALLQVAYYNSVGNITGAIGSICECLKVSPTKYETLKGFSDVLKLCGSKEFSLEIAEVSFEHNPSSFFAALDLFEGLINCREHKRAHDLVVDLVKLAKKDAEKSIYLYDLLVDFGITNGTDQLLNAVLSLSNPSDEHLLKAIVRALQNKSWKSHKFYYTQLLEKSNLSAKILLSLCDIFLEFPDLNLAQQCLINLSEHALSPVEQKDYFFLQAKSFILISDPESALNCLKRVSFEKNNNPKGFVTQQKMMGDCYRLLGKLATAERHYEVSIKPDVRLASHYLEKRNLALMLGKKFETSVAAPSANDFQLEKSNCGITLPLDPRNLPNLIVNASDMYGQACNVVVILTDGSLTFEETICFKLLLMRLVKLLGADDYYQQLQEDVCLQMNCLSTVQIFEYVEHFFPKYFLTGFFKTIRSCVGNPIDEEASFFKPLVLTGLPCPYREEIVSLVHASRSYDSKALSEDITRLVSDFLQDNKPNAYDNSAVQRNFEDLTVQIYDKISTLEIDRDELFLDFKHDLSTAFIFASIMPNTRVIDLSNSKKNIWDSTFCNPWFHDFTCNFSEQDLKLFFENYESFFNFFGQQNVINLSKVKLDTVFSDFASRVSTLNLGREEEIKVSFSDHREFALDAFFSQMK